MLRVLFFSHRLIQYNNCIKGALLAVAAMLAMTISLTAAPLFTSVQVSDVGYWNSIGEANTSRNVAVASNGDIYVVFSGSDGIRVAKSIDGGQTFAPSVQVSASNGEAEIDIASNGTVYVAWLDWANVYFSRSIDGGSTFSPALAVGSTTSYYGVHIASDGPNVYLLETNSNVLYYNNDYGLGSFNGTYIFWAAFSDVGVDPLTGIVYVMSDTPTLRLFESLDNGASFYQKPLSPGGDIFYSSYTLSSGPLGVFMFVSGTGYEAYKVDVITGGMTYQNYGGNWNAQGRTLASDEYGNLVDGYNDGYLKFHVSFNQGASFQPDIAVSWGSWDYSHNVAINPVTHDIVVVYEQYDQIFLSVYDHELKIPLDVATTGFTKVDCYSATVDGKVINDGAGRIVQRGVVYGTNPNPTIADNVVSTGAGEGAFTEALTNLCPGVTYYARAFGTDSWGDTWYGDDVIISSSPTFTVNLDPTSLWPPNHKMSTINATIISDIVCGYSFVIESITSNEPDNGLGDGDKPDDIQLGANDLSFNLRAERSGKGTGRVYTVIYAITDACGGEYTASATVSVPHDMDKEGFAYDDNSTNTIAVYPNPAEEYINVFLNFVYSANVSIILTDLMGNKVSSTEINSTNNIQKQIDIQNLAPGAYFVRIQFGEEQFVKTIIKN